MSEVADAIIAQLLRNHGSHERPEALHDMWASGHECADDPDVFAEILIDVWVGRNEKMAGNLHPDDWVELFDACRWPLTDGAEVPECPFTAYRAGHPDGMSWTLSIDVARHFAERGRVIHECTITEPLDVLGVFNEREEHEVVLRPSASWRETVREIL